MAIGCDFHRVPRLGSFCLGRWRAGGFGKSNNIISIIMVVARLDLVASSGSLSRGDFLWLSPLGWLSTLSQQLITINWIWRWRQLWSLESAFGHQKWSELAYCSTSLAGKVITLSFRAPSRRSIYRFWNRRLRFAVMKNGPYWPSPSKTIWRQQ